MASLTVNIQAKDDTKFTARRVPSSGPQDFVTVRVDDAVALMLFTSAQAATLLDAVRDAYVILKKIEFDAEQQEFELNFSESI